MRKPMTGALPTDDAQPPQMPPRFPMTGAPANNPAVGQPGPTSGATGQPAPPVPPPIQPSGGGPTSPLNVDEMLHPAQTLPNPGMPPAPQSQPGVPGGTPPPRTPLPPWGSQGATAIPSTRENTLPDDVSSAGMGAQAGAQSPTDAMAEKIHAGSPSLVMLRMMHALGKLG